MKFVFISYINTPSFNRPEDWVKRISGYLGILYALSKKGHAVISIDQINYKGEYLSNGVHHYFLNFGKGKLYVPWQLHRVVKKLKPDIIVVHGLHFPLQVIQLRFQVGKNVKIIVQHHAEMPFSGLKASLLQMADSSIDAYLFCSKAMGEVWFKKSKLRSFKKIHEVMEVSSEFHLMDKTAGKSKIDTAGSSLYLWVGRLDENKDPLTVINAFIRFSRIQPSARLYMIFQTTELLKVIEQCIEDGLGNKDVITLAGKIPHDEMIHWYNDADFIISSSHYEGSGTAVCEAMSCGCIPILTDIPSFRMMSDNGNCGLLYPPGDANALLSVLIKSTVIDITDSKRKILEQFNANLSFDAIAERFQDIALSL